MPTKGTQCDNCSYGPLEKCKIDEDDCPTKEMFMDYAKRMGAIINDLEALTPSPFARRLLKR